MRYAVRDPAPEPDAAADEHAVLPPPHAADAPATPTELSLPEIFRLLLRNRWLILAGVLAVVVPMTGLTLTKPRSYSATTTFFPQARKTAAAGLSGLAAQFGLALPSAETQSPQFYVDLLESREILQNVLRSEVGHRREGRPARDSVIVLAAEPGLTGQRRAADGLQRLADWVDASASPRTGVITVRVTTDDPELSRSVAARLLELLDQFNRESRQSQASAERQFTEAQKREAEEGLRAAEDRLQAFLLRNRDYRGSPILTFEHERLSRALATRTEVFASLSQAFEQARIEEVRDTPVLTVIDAPDLPGLPDPRGLLGKLVLWSTLGAVLGMVAASLREYRRARRRAL